MENLIMKLPPFKRMWEEFNTEGATFCPQYLCWAAFRLFAKRFCTLSARRGVIIIKDDD